MNADGTSPRRVTEMIGAGAPVWMPDGKSILISHGDSLVRLDVPSGRTTTVPWADARTLFVVDASGQWVAFQTHQGDSLTIAAVPITGGTPRVILPVVLRGLPPVVLAVGALALLPAESQEPLPGSRPGAGLEERDARESDGFFRPSISTSRTRRSRPTARSSSTRAAGGRVTSSFCEWRSRRGTSDARPSPALAPGSRWRFAAVEA